MAKTDIWLPIYVGDYLADTMHLTTAQHGAYLLLLMHEWKTGPLPSDDVQLAGIARCDMATWKRSIWPVLHRFFTADRDGWVQRRLELVREEQAGKSQKRSTAGGKGAAKRWEGHSKPNGKRMANASQINGKQHADAIANRCQSESEIESKKERLASSTPKPPRGPRIDDDDAFWQPLGDSFTLDQHDRGRRKTTLNGWLLQKSAELAIDAARMDRRYSGPWDTVLGWCRSDISSEHFVKIIEGIAARPGYKPPNSLGYFDKAVREAWGKR